MKGISKGKETQPASRRVGRATAEEPRHRLPRGLPRAQGRGARSRLRVPGLTLLLGLVFLNTLWRKHRQRGWERPGWGWVPRSPLPGQGGRRWPGVSLGQGDEGFPTSTVHLQELHQSTHGMP